ncbi:MAG: sigma-54-dependent Fis family transcriptional regulator [Myxococcales bacterium]|nr:sigma-54-dependent Fis family transcriptional regulator [Myxococcales bacterium]
MNETYRLLIVDDDEDLCQFLQLLFETHGYEVATANSAEEGRARLELEAFDAVLVDVNLGGGMNGVDFSQWLVEHRPATPSVIMTAHASLDTTISAIRAGSIDFLRKPLSPEETVVRLTRVIETQRLRGEVQRLQSALAEDNDFEGLVGQSREMQRLRAFLDRICDSPVSVLITGETGTGKEVVARALHDKSARRHGPFVAVNCAAIPEGLFESELFGHAKGAFTDARLARTGLLLEANGGTLFLDELGDMPVSVQPKLLRALEERVVRPVGADVPQPLDIRVLAASNADLESRLAEGTFREDLYFRINVVHVRLPPLRTRGNDILLLAQHFLERFARASNKEVTGIHHAVAQRLLAYPWPGNVRELRNAIEHCVALTVHDMIGVDDLPSRVADYRSSHVVIAGDNPDELSPMHEVERRYIQRVLEAVGGNKSRAAKILQFDRTTLYRKLERYEIDAP